MSLIRFDLGQNWEIKIFGWMDPGHHSWYPATLLLNVRVDKLLLEHVGLTHVLDLAVHLVNFLAIGWMSQGGHSEPLLLLALFYQSTPSCLKVGGGVVGGGPSDYCVSPSPFGLYFGTLDFGTSDLGLTIMKSFLLSSITIWLDMNVLNHMCNIIPAICSL